MSFRDWREKLAFKGVNKFENLEDYLDSYTPPGEMRRYEMNIIELGNLPWIPGGWEKWYEEGVHPPFRTTLPWAQDDSSSNNVQQTLNGIAITQPKEANAPSGILWSNFTIKHGTVRALIKLPNVKGAWSAFWLFAGLPELDILEHCGEWKHQFTATHHWGYDYENIFGKEMTNHNERYNKRLDLHNEYHLFEVLFTPYEVIYLVDGVEHRKVTKGIPTMDTHIIFNVTKGDYCDSAITEALSEDATMHVKWLEVYDMCP